MILPEITKLTSSQILFFEQLSLIENIQRINELNDDVKILLFDSQNKLS